MRFRKRVKIMKGLSLNFSGSGISLSAGVRGASVTIGKKGTYLNSGIPGTGLYKRTKVSGGSNVPPKPNSSNSVDRIVEKTGYDKDTNFSISISLDEKGSPNLSITTGDGSPVYNETIIRKVKGSFKYKEAVENLIEKRKRELEEETAKFINIASHTPEVITESNLKAELNKLQLQSYSINEYAVRKPQIEDAQSDLELLSKQSINKFFFWQNKKLRKEYVKENLGKCFNHKMNVWETEKKKYELKETEIKNAKDKEYKELYDSVKNDLENMIKGEEKYVNETIEKIINELILPVEFTVDFEYHSEIGELKIDLDLPEVENLPQSKVNTLSSGKISIKNKTQKEINDEYTKCVCGMAFFLGGTFFNISTKINSIIISGYTQRLNKSIGTIEDQYIYSVKFVREKFKEISFDKIDPIQAFSNFETKMNVSTSHDFRTIIPW